MPLNIDVATTYVMEFIQALFIILGETYRVIATNSSVANNTADDIYYIFGLVKWLTHVGRDMLEITMANQTLMNYSVEMWQKLGTNATYALGDWSGNHGIAYIAKRGYVCAQPGQYCESYGFSETYHALQMHKWMFRALAEIGKRLSTIYP